VARAWHVDLAGILLIAWAGLIAYVSVPTLLGEDPLWDGGVSLLGALVATAHLIAALGVFTRQSWGRRLGLVVGGVGAVGTGLVLVTLAANVGSVPAPAGPASPLVLGIPAAMFATYLAVVLILWRARPAFAPR
jgi:hypothetical protein